MLVWHRAERAAGTRERLALAGRWIAAALVFALLAGLGVYALTGSPPRLTGG